MSKRHKWYREICAWADGLEVQARFVDRNHNDDWQTFGFDGIEVEDWNDANFEFRIKPQPIQTFKAPTEPTHVKKPQYLYVYLDDNYELSTIPLDNDKWTYIGRIKLEVEE